MYYCLYLLVTVEFITHPSNLTVCSGGVAVFTCEVNRNGFPITAAVWQIFRQNHSFVSVSNLQFHSMTNTLQVDKDTLTSRLTVTNITSNNNGSIYRCFITKNATSYTAQLAVAGKYVQHLSIIVKLQSSYILQRVY